MASSLTISQIIQSPSDDDDSANATPRLSYYRDVLQVNPVPVLLRIRRLRILVCTALSVASLTLATYWLSGGVTLRTVTAESGNARRELVQDYNFYVGGMAALFTWPLQMMATIVLPIALWTFATGAVMAAEPGRAWKVKALVYSVCFAILWLLSNSFHGINVQPLVSSPTNGIQELRASEFVVPSRNWSQPTSDGPGNPSVNTVLRSVITGGGGQRTSQSACGLPSPTQLSSGIEYGFSTREWMSTLVSSSMAPDSSARFRLGNTVDHEGDIALLGAPSTRTLAAHAFPLLQSFFSEKLAKNASDFDYNGGFDQGASNRSAVLQEDVQNAFQEVLRASDSQLVSWFDATNVEVEFAITKLSTTGLSFESMSFQIPFKAEYMQRELTVVNGTTTSVSYASPGSQNGSPDDIYFDVNVKEECGETSCIVSPRGEKMTHAMVDEGSQIRALSICMDSQSGREDFIKTALGTLEACPVRSTSSFLVFSFAQRIVGEQLEKVNDGVIRLKNAKKIYSVTIGRLHWMESDLADIVGITCSTGDDCSGIATPLSATKTLMVGQQGFNLDGLRTHSSGMGYWPALTTARAHEIDLGGQMKGDLILPRNFNTSVASLGVQSQHCEVERGQLLETIEATHRYSEHALQPAYTSALFWLFQDGVVFDADTATIGSRLVTSSKQNPASDPQVVQLVVTIPRWSAMCTYVACFLISILSLCVVVFGKRQECRIEQHFTPHHLAHALVGKASPLFPSSLLLQTDLLHVGGGGVLNSSVPLDEFDIESLTLRHRHTATAALQVPKPLPVSPSTSSSSHNIMSSHPSLV